MLELRRSEDRGFADHGWLKSRHTFSFADYYDADEMGFGALRVINEDQVQPGQGFGTHGHRDMEIVSYVLEGELEHKDSIGNGSIIRPGDVQRMSAGRGVLHSEYNPSKTAPVHFLQIWIMPNVRGIAPGYEQKYFGAEEKRGRLRLIASPEGANDSVRLHQDARIHAGLFDGSEQDALSVAPGRLVYVHVARGALTVNGEALREGDGLKISEVASVDISGGRRAEVLVFDIPGI